MCLHSEQFAPEHYWSDVMVCGEVTMGPLRNWTAPSDLKTIIILKWIKTHMLLQKGVLSYIEKN